MWQMPFGPPPAAWNFNTIINEYIADLGGAFLAGPETCVGAAPYFALNATTVATYLGVAIQVSTLTFAGGIATATTATAHGYSTGNTVQVQNASQVQYCGLFTITVTGTTTFTYPVTGTPVTPATTANGLIAKGISCVLNPPYAREITAVSVAGSVMTCTSTGHGWSSGKMVNLSNGTAIRNPRFPYPGNYGQFFITVIDANTFSVVLPSSGGQATQLPTNTTRQWAWDSSAIQVLIDDLITLDVLKNQFYAVPVTATTYGATVRCYEGGYGNMFGTPQNAHPYLWDLCTVTHNSQQFAPIYLKYFDLLYNTYNVKQFTQFNHIFAYATSGFWGIKEFQHEVNPPVWDAIMSVVTGTPDFTDDAPLPFPGFIASSLVVVSGGAIVGGKAQGSVPVYVITVKGGLVMGGTAPGSAPVNFAPPVSGGVVAGGQLVPKTSFAPPVAGGIVQGGNAQGTAGSLTFTAVVSGGMPLGGAASGSKLGTWTHVQGTGAVTTSSAANLSATFGSSVAAGNLIVVSASPFLSNLTVSDSAGNVYKVALSTVAFSPPLYVWYTTASTTGPLTVTVTFLSPRRSPG